ncbi:MAG: hypothetical protein JWO20_3231 [Candidatus Angelobacter sp.]|jgi:hypothetical protein|nr:hypothetical protein [Candidatus Angelobacter sp.]
MSDQTKTLVSSSALKTLLESCEDAIDFNDESDELAAAAFNRLTEATSYLGKSE